MNKKILTFINTLFLILTLNINGQVNIDGIKIEKRKPLLEIGKETDDIYFNVPLFITYNKYDSLIYVSDSENHRIVVLDQNLKLIKTIGNLGQGPLEFNSLSGLAFNNDGNIFICDRLNQRIQIYKSLDDIKMFSLKNDKGGQLKYINVDKENRIYLNSPESGKLMVLYNEEGDEITKFGNLMVEGEIKEKIRGRYNEVFHVIDENENIYLAFAEYPVIRKFDKNLKLVYEINYDNLPEIEFATGIWNERLKKLKAKNPPGILGFPKNFLKGLTVDKKFLYIGLGAYSKLVNLTIYVLEKENGKFIKKIMLYNTDDSKDHAFTNFTVSDKFIYKIFNGDSISLIQKYKK